MFVLDTNILSALMSPKPATEVATWIAGQPLASLFTAAVCQAEILSGIAVLPPGRRRAELEVAARAVFTEDFDGRVLPFDSEAAMAYADIFAARRQLGRPIATVDLMIASIARSQSATVVTRDTAGFADCGRALINPWESCSPQSVA
jgi:predicted nucleic acid-binding protein